MLRKSKGNEDVFCVQSICNVNNLSSRQSFEFQDTFIWCYLVFNRIPILFISNQSDGFSICDSLAHVFRKLNWERIYWKGFQISLFHSAHLLYLEGFHFGCLYSSFVLHDYGNEGSSSDSLWNLVQPSIVPIVLLNENENPLTLIPELTAKTFNPFIVKFKSIGNQSGIM